MAEGWEPMSRADLEAALQGVGLAVSYPAVPDVAATVARRVGAHPRAQRAWFPLRMPSVTALRPLVRPVWQRVAVAAAAVLVLAGGILPFSPSARRAVADFLGLRGERIKVVRTPPSAPIRPLGDGLDLGERLTLAQARARVSYRVFVPGAAELGSPDEVYLLRSDLGEQVSLVYRSRTGIPQASTTGVGLLVNEFRGRVEQRFIEKFIGPGATVEAVQVNGHPGFWIEGQPHAILYVGPNGEPIPDTVRLAANVLVWEQGDVTIRIESLLTRGEALRIAESVR
jgi:hypothetical protein